MAKAVYGIYTNRNHAEEAVETLREAGFRAQDLSVLLPENTGNKDIGYEKHTKAPEHAAKAGAAGGVLGGAVGWLLGMGALAIPGIGPFVAAGPIMGALAGLGAGSVIGGLAGALTGMGIPEYEAKRYEGRIRSGGALISIHCETDIWTSRAKEMLRHTGAEDISSTDEAPVSRRDRVADEPVPVSTVPVDHTAVPHDYVDTAADRTLRHREVVPRDVEHTTVTREYVDTSSGHVVRRDPIDEEINVTREREFLDTPADDPTITRRITPRHRSE